MTPCAWLLSIVVQTSTKTKLPSILVTRILKVCFCKTHGLSQEFVSGGGGWKADNRSRRRRRRGKKGYGPGEGCPSPQRGVLLPSRLGGLRELRKLPQRGPGQSTIRKRVLEYVELEKSHLIATNVSYLTFLRHKFSHIHNKHKTFTYIFVPLHSQNGWAHFSTLWGLGPQPPSVYAYGKISL